MRIITGKARGVRLWTLEGVATRPTSERTKEAVFSMLQFEIAGSVVLDLFAGSGQMGLEALSRGALRTYFIDGAKPAFEIIKKNIEKSRLGEGAVAFCEDSLSFLKRQSGAEQFDIVFLDPPYASDLINGALTILCEKNLIKNSSYIVCESNRADVLNINNAERYEVIKAMKHGVAHVSVLKLKGGSET